MEQEESDTSQRESSDQQHPPSPPLPPSATQGFLEKQLEGAYSQRIQERPAATRGEVMLNIQEFCRQHPVPLTAQEDLHRLINSIFHQEIIPETTYKLDKLYSSAGNIQYFFYCSKCFSNFGELDRKILKSKQCPECGTVNAIGDLTKAHYFIIMDFVKQLQLVLNDPAIASVLKNPNEFPDNGDTIRDLYDGLMYKKFAASLDFSNGQYYMSFTACTDGTPVFKSSTLSIWPIFVTCNELPAHVRMSNVRKESSKNGSFPGSIFKFH